VSEQALMIGRSDRADISLLEPTVSRQHATVQAVEDRVMLRDLGSKHGTFVNSKRVTTARLKVGDIVVFGLSLVMRLEVSDQPIPMPPAGSKLSGSSQEIMELPSSDLAVTAVRTLTIPPRSKKPSSGEQSASTEGVLKLQNQVAKLQKLAAAGGLCLAHLPAIESELKELAALLQRQAGRAGDLGAAQRLLDALLARVKHALEALAVFPLPGRGAADLGETAESALRALTAELARREVRVLEDLPRGLVVEADPVRLKEAMLELLRGALSSSAQGGLIEVQVARAGGKIVLHVVDHGDGIPSEVLDRVFDPFVTRSEDWEPLGLALLEARQIVMLHGGTLQIERRSGSGNTIRVSFPASERRG
jgi:signal transduction histidine kinase